MASIELEDVTIEFPILHQSHRSLKKTVVAAATGGAILHDAHKAPVVRGLAGVTAAFNAGDRVGLIGPNGAGKTTMLRVIAGIYEPIRGQLRTRGRIMTLLDLSLGMSSDMTGRENILLRGLYMGLRPSEMRALAPEIEAFTELGDFLDMPIRTYSSGMQLRLSFAIATALAPDILLMDEWLLAGDAAFTAKASARIEKFVRSSSILVLASHAEAAIRQWCNKAVYLSGGELRAFGEVDEVLETYKKSTLIS